MFWSKMAAYDFWLSTTCSPNACFLYAGRDPANSRSTITRSRSQKTRSRPDRELQNRPLSANHDLKKKLCNFSRKTVQFLVIANCRNRPLSANHDLKTNDTVFREK